MIYPESFPLLSFSEDPDNVPFNIHRLKHADKKTGAHNQALHQHNYIEIVYITKGSGTFLIDLDQHPLKADRLFLVQPKQVHQLRPGNDTEGYVIVFTENFLAMGEHEFDLIYQGGIFQTFSRSAGIDLKPEIATAMQDTIKSMVREYKQPDIYRNEMLHRYLKIFLIYLTRQCQQDLQTSSPSAFSKLVQLFISLIDQHYKTSKKVNDYAQQLAVTANYLNEIVKKTTGQPASYHIRQRIVLEAKRLAAYSDISMKDIAGMLGFSDVSHFSKFFKHATNIKFSDFQKERVRIEGANGQ